MRTTPHAVVALLLAASVVTSADAAKEPPTLRAKQAHAQAVLAQVNALDIRFGELVDSWDGARLQLAASKRALAANEVALRRARRRSQIADAELAERLVAIYKGDGEPSLIEVIVGASTLSDLIDRLQAATAIASYDRQLADRALHSQQTLATADRRLHATEQKRRATVDALAAERRQISRMLAQRRHLLASIQSEIAAAKAHEAARQQALAAAARARLAHAEAAARAAAKAAAAHAEATTTTAATPPASTTPEPAPPTTQPAATTPTATTTAAAATTTTAPGAVPPPALGTGHPQAASIALNYLGIPYQWGGASPATGFDCSGLVMYVYAQLGIQLPHQAAAQYGYGVPVARDQLQPGDLVFFDDLGHVGIYIGNGEIVHAPQTGDVVKITPLAQFGSRYVGARRL